MARHGIVVLLALTLASSAYGQSGGGYDVEWSDAQAAAAALTGGGFSLRGAVGQPDASVGTGSGFSVDGGVVPGLCTGTITSYGSGCPGAGGVVPSLAIAGCADFGETIRFDIAGGLGGSQVFLFLGLGEGSLPMGAGCQLLTVPLLPAILGPIPLGGVGPGTGTVSFPAAVGNIPGVTVTLQAFVSDASTPVGFANSNGISIFHG